VITGFLAHDEVVVDLKRKSEREEVGVDVEGRAARKAGREAGRTERAARAPVLRRVRAATRDMVVRGAMGKVKGGMRSCQQLDGHPGPGVRRAYRW
jgi:hypothetical protein